MPHICISGYYGFGNQGDEWILEALVTALRSAGHELTVLSAAPAETQARHGVRGVPRWNIWACARAIAACDTLVSGGGGLLQDVTGPWTPAYYLSLMIWARLLGKRVVVAGQGLGPIQRRWNQWLCRRVLAQAERVILRDEDSLAWCLRTGVKAEKLFLGADWVWTLSRPRTEAGTREDWGICLRADALPATPPAWLETWLALAQRLRVRVQWVVLGNRGDRACAAAWRARFPNVDSQVMDLSGMPLAQAEAQLKRLAWLISLRYHGLIAGARAGAWVSGVGHDPKISQLLVALGSAEVGSLKDPAEWETLWAERPRALARQASQVGALQARSQAALQELVRAIGTRG